MPFAAKSALPIVSDRLLRQDVVERASVQQIAVFHIPPGYLRTDGVAAALMEHGRPVVRLGLDPEDADLTTFVLPLIAADERVVPRACVELQGALYNSSILAGPWLSKRKL